MSIITRAVEYPRELLKVYRIAIRYEWISFLYMISAATFSFLVMSNSQTMKTVWLEDLLGIVPPASFLVSSKIIRWRATVKFPYGFHKMNGMAFLTSSLALFILGIFLLCDGLHVLLKQEHPTISNTVMFGNSIWMGYVMIIALLWSSIPSTFLGHVKIPLAHKLYDKILYADAKMNKASWTSGFASIIGIIGIGLGYWWADATVGIIISFSIIRDGYENLSQSIYDMLDEVPRDIGSREVDPLIPEVKSLVLKESYVKSVNLRFRDDGHVFFGEVYIEPQDKEISIQKIHTLRDKIQQYHWRLHDIVIMPVKHT